MQNTRTPKRNRLPKHARGSFNADSRIYTVAGGGEDKGFDTLFSIAERFGVSVEYLKGVNNLIMQVRNYTYQPKGLILKGFSLELIVYKLLK